MRIGGAICLWDPRIHFHSGELWECLMVLCLQFVGRLSYFGFNDCIKSKFVELIFGQTLMTFHQTKLYRLTLRSRTSTSLHHIKYRLIWCVSIEIWLKNGSCPGVEGFVLPNAWSSIMSWRLCGIEKKSQMIVSFCLHASCICREFVICSEDSSAFSRLAMLPVLRHWNMLEFHVVMMDGAWWSILGSQVSLLAVSGRRQPVHSRGLNECWYHGIRCRPQVRKRLNRKRGIHVAPKRKNFISGLEVMVTRPRSDTIDQLLRTSKLQRSLTVEIFPRWTRSSWYRSCWGIDGWYCPGASSRDGCPTEESDSKTIRLVYAH